MNVLVLNMDYQPLSVTNLRRGFRLVFKGKAEILEHIKDEPIKTSSGIFKRPSVIRLLRYIKVPYKELKLTRENIFRRDNFQCLYCDSEKNLTIDHVLPKSRGGKNTWKNLATSCYDCNITKDDQTPEEAGMELRYDPFKPNFIYIIEKIEKIGNNWKFYLGVE